MTTRERSSLRRPDVGPAPRPSQASGRTAGFAALPPPDRELQARLQEGDPEAVARFFDLYCDRVYGYIRGLLHDEHLAEDLTQDVFASIHGRLSAYDPQRDLAPWVFTIATNKVRDYWRSRRHQDSRLESSIENDERPLQVPDDRGGPRRELELEELGAEVRRAVEQLPDGMRQTVVLRIFEGLSFEAIGGILERSEIAVRKRYSRALAVLRDLLDPSALSILAAA